MLGLMVSLLMTLPGKTHAAEGIYMGEVGLSLDADHEYWLLRADASFELGPRMEEAINRGVALYFTLDTDLVRRRWYWWDDRAINHSLTFRLVFNALTREYRVSNGGLQQRYSRLEEALLAIGRVRNLRVAEAGALIPGERYEMTVRMRLDVSQLPKPLQVNVLTSRDWYLPSEPRRLRFEVPER